MHVDRLFTEEALVTSSRAMDELRQLLQRLDPARLRQTAFEMGVDYWVYASSEERFAGALIEYFLEQERLADLVAYLRTDPGIADQLAPPPTPAGPAYGLWEIELRPRRGALKVAEIKTRCAHWCRLRPDERVTLLGCWRSLSRTHLLVGMPERSSGDAHIYQAVQRSELLAVRPLENPRSVFHRDRRSLWQDLVLDSDRGNRDQYRLYGPAAFYGPDWRRRRFVAAVVLLLIAVVLGLWAYPRLVAGLASARAQTQAAWVVFRLQAGRVLLWIWRTIWSMIRATIATALLLGLTFGGTWLVLLLRRRPGRQLVRELLADLDDLTLWIVLALVNGVMYILVILFIAGLSGRRLTGWDYGTPFVLAGVGQWVGLAWVRGEWPPWPIRRVR
jgi:hypothetical protein